MEHLTGKVAFITGGASGIGLGMARAFLEEGMKVSLADWSDEHIARAKEQLAGNNAVHFVKTNVADRDSVRAAAARSRRGLANVSARSTDWYVARLAEPLTVKSPVPASQSPASPPGSAPGCAITSPVIRPALIRTCSRVIAVLSLSPTVQSEAIATALPPSVNVSGVWVPPSSGALLTARTVIVRSAGVEAAPAAVRPVNRTVRSPSVRSVRLLTKVSVRSAAWSSALVSAVRS